MWPDPETVKVNRFERVTITQLRDQHGPFLRLQRCDAAGDFRGGRIDVRLENIRGLMAAMIEAATLMRAREIAAEMACDDCGRVDGTHDPDVEH